MVRPEIWKTVVKQKRRALEEDKNFDIEQACLLEEDFQIDAGMIELSVGAHTAHSKHEPERDSDTDGSNDELEYV